MCTNAIYCIIYLPIIFGCDKLKLFNNVWALKTLNKRPVFKTENTLTFSGDWNFSFPTTSFPTQYTPQTSFLLNTQP